MGARPEHGISSRTLCEASRRLREWSAEEVARSKRAIQQARVLKEIFVSLNLSKVDLGYDDAE